MTNAGSWRIGECIVEIVSPISVSALFQKFWSEHRVASVISLGLMFLGLMAKPWTLILVLLVAFGGPVLQRFAGFSKSPIGAWRRSSWTISALAVAVALLATSGTDAGEGLLILALLPVAWTLATDKSIFNRSSEIPNKAKRIVENVSLKVEKDNSRIVSKPRPQLNEPLTGKELLDKIDSLGDVSTAKLLEACGYIIMEDDGIARRYYTKFHEALLQAKGITESIASDPEQYFLERKQKADTIQQVDVGMKTGSDLAATVKFNKYEDATWFALNYGYLRSDGQADLPAFYDNLLISLGFPQVFDEDDDNVAEFIHENEGGCSPMLDGRKVVGRYGIRISGVARDYDWDETEWEEVKEETGEDHLDSPYEVQKSTSFELQCYNNYSLESACAEFGGKFIDLFRPSYNNLSDDENGETIDTFLENYEEEPIYYVELAEKLGFITIDKYSKDSEHNSQPKLNNIEGYADGKENKVLPSASLSTSTGEGSRHTSTIESQQLPVESVDIDSLAISRVPLQIKEGSGPFSTKVIESTIGKPDDDGDVSVDLKLSLSSYAEEDVELVVSKLVVLTASGLPLLESEDEHDVLISNRSSEEISLSSYFKASQIAGAPASDTQLLVQFIPCGCKFIELSQIEVASPGNITGIAEAIQLLPYVQLQGLSVLATKPDDDGDCLLEFKGLVINECESVLNKVVVSITILDRNGREIDSTEWRGKAPPSNTVSFDTRIWGVKSSKIAGSKVHVSIKVFQCLGNQEISWSVGSKPDPIEAEGGVANAGKQASASPKVPPSLSSDQASSLPSMDLEAGNCNAFDLEITTATYRKPDEDGDTRYEAQYSVINRSDQAIELLMARLFILHPSGLVVATTEDDSEDMAEKGESINASSSTWGTSVKELDGDPSSAQLLLQVTACSCSFQELGSIECPSSGSTLTLKPKHPHDAGLVVEAITITAEPPDDVECCLRIKALIKNNTTSTIPRAILSTKLISSSGRELEDTYIQEEIAANSEVVLEDSLWGVKVNRINSANLKFNLKAFAAAGISRVVTKNLSVED